MKKAIEYLENEKLKLKSKMESYTFDHLKPDINDNQIEYLTTQGNIDSIDYVIAIFNEAIVRGGGKCDCPRDKREYIGQNTLRCKVCGSEFQ